MKTVYTTTSLADAELIRVRLRKQRIQSNLEGENIGIRGPATPIAVVVRNKDEARGMKIVELSFAHRKARTRRSPEPK